MRFNRLTIAAAALALVAAGAVPLISASASAGAPEPTTKYKVSMKLSTTRATTKEDKVVLKGKVTPAAPGSTVRVQVLYENQKTWGKAGFTKIKKDGTYKFSFTPRTRRDRMLRVYKPGDDKAKAGTSKALGLQVIGWVWLSSMTPSSMDGVSVINSMPINGDNYGHTLYSSTDTPNAYVEYTLGRHAYWLQSTYGLSDRTASGGQGMVTVRSDGAMRFSQTFNLGESVHQKTNLTDVFRIRIDFAQVADTEATEPSAGAPRVLMD